MAKIKRWIVNLKVAGKIKGVSADGTCYDSIFSAGNAYFNHGDPFEYKGDYGGVVSGGRIYTGIGNNDL